MDKGDVEMLDAKKNVPSSDVLVSNESPIEYKNGVKTGKSNAEDKTDDQCDSKEEDLKNARSETEDQLNSKSWPEAHNNVVLENETPTIDAGTNDMVSGYLNLTNDESDKMIYEDPQIEANPTTVTIDGDARSCKFPKVKLEVTDSSIGKKPEPASPMFSINPSTEDIHTYIDIHAKDNKVLVGTRPRLYPNFTTKVNIL
ncbi:hypothetical protein R3W88_031873 [Solanum pinnatisectum]|uniref:Uncharacterized protein n=1 Tax=Solanum pinnatisectum TaxID=50273 RepID=A0AAV9LML2_9SOLN|nr:hypothetical protein R3W88_031873 [Solanum pinnatisectum]